MPSPFEDRWDPTPEPLSYGETPAKRTGPSGASNNIQEGPVAPSMSNGLAEHLNRQTNEIAAIAQADEHFRALKKGEIVATQEDAERLSRLRQALQAESQPINPNPEVSADMHAKLDAIKRRFYAQQGASDRWGVADVAKELTSVLTEKQTGNGNNLATAIEQGLIAREKAQRFLNESLARAEREHTELLKDAATREKAAFEAYRDSLNAEERAALDQNLAAALEGMKSFNEAKRSAVPEFTDSEVDALLQNLGTAVTESSLEH